MEKKKVGIWIRVSTDEQAKGDGPEHHQKRGEMYAQSKGWEVVAVYHLEGVSGKSVVNHAEAKRMFADVRQQCISGLIFSNLSRLGRSTKELIDISEFFQKHNADLISLAESLDTSTAAGRLFFTIQSALAQCEREQIAARIQASVKTRAKLGKSVGGQAPFGFKQHNGSLVIEESEAAVRKLMYQLFLEHGRKQTVARILNERGHRTRKGKLFNHATVNRMLEDPVSKGLRRMNYTTASGTSDGSWEFKPESEWVYQEVPAIVDEDTWKRVNDLIAQGKVKNKRVSRKAKHIFTGFLFCSCGGRMYRSTHTAKYHCQNCHRPIAAADIEEMYAEQLKCYVFSEQELKDQLMQGRTEQKDIEREIRKLKSDASELTQELRSLVKLHSENQIPTNGFNKLYAPIAAQLEEVTNTIPELEGKRDAIAIQANSVDQIIDEAKDLYKRFKKMTEAEKRRVVETTTSSITVGEDTVNIKLFAISPQHHQLVGATPPFNQGGNGDTDPSTLNQENQKFMDETPRIQSKRPSCPRTCRSHALEDAYGHHQTHGIHRIANEKR